MLNFNELLAQSELTMAQKFDIRKTHTAIKEASPLELQELFMDLYTLFKKEQNLKSALISHIAKGECFEPSRGNSNTD